MKDFYEGSVAEIGTSEWTEPHDVSAVTSEIAAIEVLASHAEVHEVALQQEMDVCVRQVTVEGEPLGDWQYFRGKAWAVFRTEARPIIPENSVYSPTRSWISNKRWVGFIVRAGWLEMAGCQCGTWGIQVTNGALKSLQVP